MSSDILRVRMGKSFGQERVTNTVTEVKSRPRAQKDQQLMCDDATKERDTKQHIKSTATPPRVPEGSE